MNLVTMISQPQMILQLKILISKTVSSLMTNSLFSSIYEQCKNQFHNLFPQTERLFIESQHLLMQEENATTRQVNIECKFSSIANQGKIM